MDKQIEKAVGNIVEQLDTPAELLTTAENLATFALRNMVGERRDVALRLACALVDYSALDEG